MAVSAYNGTYTPSVYWYNSSNTSVEQSFRVELINEFIHDDVVGVELYVTLPGVYEGVVVGVAKRDPVDRPNDEIGIRLAYGRAFDKVARKLLRQADGLVKHQDYIRETKRASKVPAKKAAAKKAAGKKA